MQASDEKAMILKEVEVAEIDKTRLKDLLFRYE